MNIAFDDRRRRWAELKDEVARCRECSRRWPSVEGPLTPKEIPDPEGDVRLLFVGVAPPPLAAHDEVPGHFYTNASDRLRLGLLRVLDRLYGLSLTAENRTGLTAGTSAFLKAGFFFVHAAKVRPPAGRLAPGRPLMRFCALRHLRTEILVLRPRGVCFLGATYAAPAAESVFGVRIGEKATRGLLDAGDEFEAWTGWVVATTQPVRGTKHGQNEKRTTASIGDLREKIALELRE